MIFFVAYSGTSFRAANVRGLVFALTATMLYHRIFGDIRGRVLADHGKRCPNCHTGKQPSVFAMIYCINIDMYDGPNPR
jgi:hypothetical protein